MYLLYSTRLNIFFAIRQLDKYNIDPQIESIKIVKKVIYYLKSIMYLNLIYDSYLKDKREIKVIITPFLFKFIRYKDSSCTKDFADKKSIIRYYYFINKIVIS